MSVRGAAVAGRFYPAEAAPLRAVLRRLLAASAPSRDEETPPRRLKALIAPHAGYDYSGAIAASAYARLAGRRADVRRVVLLGPAHYLAFRGLAASTATSFATPLGDVLVEAEGVARVRRLPQVQALDAAHAPEHSLEVHLPFLLETVSSFQLVPLLVGDASAEEVRQVLDVLWGGDETVIVVSSDLSHFHDYETAKSLDAQTSGFIEGLQLEALSGERACGHRAIGGLLAAASERRLQVRAVDVRSSGDTAGGRARVVGYGAYVVE